MDLHLEEHDSDNDKVRYKHKTKICFACLEKGEQETISGDSGHLLLTCEKCKIRVHLRCYGEKRTYQKKKIKGKEKYVFECEKCEIKKPNEPCILCKKNDGFMKKVENSFVHVICALFCDFFEFTDFWTMTITPKFPISNILASIEDNNNKKCIYCQNGKGLLLTCECNECNQVSHIFCLLEHKMLQLKENSDATNFWQFEYNLNAKQESIYEKLDNLNNKKQTKKSTRKNSKTTKIDKATYEKNFLSFPPEKNWFVKNRGSIIKVLCESHRDQVVYCFCKKIYDQAEFMICCDNCDTWFHGNCLKINQNDQSSNKFWICTYCKEWIVNRNNFLLKEMRNEVQDDLIKQAQDKKWRNPIIHKHINYRIIDLIFMSVLFSVKTDVLINNVCCVEILQAQIRQAEEIPFNLNNQVAKLNKKLQGLKNLKVSDDHFNELNKYLGMSLIESNNTEFTLNNQLYKEVEDLYKQILEEYKEIVKNNELINNNIEELKKLLSRIKWALDVSNLLIQSKPSLQDLKQSFSTYKSLFENEKLYEKEATLVNQYIDECISWQKSTKELLNQHLKRKNDPSNDFKMGENNISHIRESYMNILNHKIKISDMIKIIDQGKRLKVNLSKEIELIEKNIEESLEWDKKFSERTGKVKEVEDLLTAMKDPLISTPLMYEAVDILDKYDIWDKKCQNVFGLFGNTSIDVSYEEINSLLDESRNISFNVHETHVEKLKQIVAKLNELKAKTNYLLLNENSVKVLKGFLKEIDFNIFNDLKDKINKKIEFIENFEEITKKKLNLEQVEELETQISNFNLEKKFSSFLEMKKHKITQIKTTINEILNRPDEIVDTLTLNKIFEEIKTHKLIIEEKEKLNDYQKINEWLDKVKQQVNIKFNYNKEALLMKEDTPNDSNNNVNLNNNNNSNSTNFDIENCHYDDLNFLEIDYIHYILEEINNYKQLLKGVSKNIYYKLYLTMWKKKALNYENISDNNNLNFDNLKELYLQAINDLNIPRNFQDESTEIRLFNNIYNLFKNYELWDKNFDALQTEIIKENMKNHNECKNLFNQLIEGSNNFLANNIEKSETLNFFQKLIDFSEKAYIFLTKSTLPHDQKVNINSVKSLFDEYNKNIKNFKDNFIKRNIAKLNLPNNFEIHNIKKLKDEVVLYDFWVENYKKIINSNKIDNYIEILQKLSEDSHNLIGSVSTQIASIKSIVESYLSWTENAKKMIVLCDNFNYVPINEVEINQIKKLSTEATQINNLDKSLIDSIKALDWIIKANNIPKHTTDYRTALKIHQEAKNLKYFNEISKKEYYSTLCHQVSLGRSIRDNIEILRHNREGGKKINEDQFENLLRDFEKCKLYMKEEKDYVENISKLKAEHEKKFDDYLSNKKALVEFEKFQSELFKFPVLSKNLPLIENVIVDSKLLIKDIKKVLDLNKQNKNYLSKTRVDHLYERYKNNKATFVEGENLVRMYDTSIESLEKLKKIVEEQKSKNLSETEILEMLNILDSIEIHNNEQEKILKRVIWFKKYETFIKCQNVLPTYQTIKNLACEGQDLDLTDSDQYSKILKLASDAEDIIKKIYSVSNSEDMAKIKEEILKMNFDVNEFVVEQETRLEYNISADRKQEVKLLGNKRKTMSVDEEIPGRQGSKYESEEDYISEDEVVKNLKKNQSQPTLNTRQKRTINIKLDKDYYYDKEFIDNLEKKIAVRNNYPSSSSVQNQSDIPIEQRNKNYIIEEEKKDIGFKAVSITSIKDSIKKTCLVTFENILSENKTFMKNGKETINKLAKILEDDFLKTNSNANDNNFKNAFNNMKKTIKELEKYPIISLLIVKGKLEIQRVSKYPYGETYIEKLKKIEEKSKKKKTEISEANLISEKEKKMIKSNNDNLINFEKRTIVKSDSNKLLKPKKDDSNLVDILQGMDDLYQSCVLTTDSKDKEKKKISQLKSELAIFKDKSTEESNSIKNEDKSNLSDNESLKSISGGDVKFSPTNNNIRKAPSSSGANNNDDLKKEKSIPSFEKNIYSLDNDLLSSKEFRSESNKFDKPYDPSENYNEIKDDSNKKKSRNKIRFVPIFYDPTKKYNSIQPTTNVMKNIASPGSRLKVWKGFLEYNSISLNSMIISQENISLFQTLSNIPEKLNINSRAKTKEVIPYIEKNFITKGKVILFGWFEIENEENIETYKKLVSEYETSDKSGYFKFLDMKIYIIPLSEKYSKFFQKVKFEKVNFFYEKVMNKIEKPLIAIIVSKKNDPVTFNFLNPEVIEDKSLTPSLGNNLISADNDKSEDKKENMSPITSDEEEGLEEGETMLKLKNPQNLNLNNPINMPNKLNPTLDIDNTKSLQALLNSDDLSFFEEYINTHFSNLSQEDLLSKLMQLDEVSRMKLLQLITQYQSKNEAIEEKENTMENKTEANDIIMQTQQSQSQLNTNNPLSYQQPFVRPQQGMGMNTMIPQNIGYMPNQMAFNNMYMQQGIPPQMQGMMPRPMMPQNLINMNMLNTNIPPNTNLTNITNTNQKFMKK